MLVDGSVAADRQTDGRLVSETMQFLCVELQTTAEWQAAYSRVVVWRITQSWASFEGTTSVGREQTERISMSVSPNSCVRPRSS